jgi:hypothetical protein
LHILRVAPCARVSFVRQGCAGGGRVLRELLHHLTIFNERHVLRALAQHVSHYNVARPHRSLVLDAPDGPIARGALPLRGRIVAGTVLGGLHHEYEWIAA